ncbi:MAG: hypothetical protein WC755_03400 [Candidatus Woesearchaeota archaeon]|jgi:hypothetical protein
MKNINKKGVLTSMLIKLVLGVLILGIIAYSIISSVPGAWTQFSKGIKEVNENDIHATNESYNFSKSLPIDAQVAVNSVELLSNAFDNLAKKEATSRDEDLSKRVYVTFYGKFAYVSKGDDNEEKEDGYCTANTKSSGKHSVFCNDNTLFPKNRENSKLLDLSKLAPLDIDTVYSFDIKVGNVVCPIRVDDSFSLQNTNPGSDATNVKIKSVFKDPGDYYEGNDLTTRSADKPCNESYSYIICNGVKVNYCGKQGWSLSYYIEESDKPNDFNFDRNTILSYVGDNIRDGLTLLPLISVDRDRATSVNCIDEGGKIVGIGNNTMCLICDPSKNNGMGECSLEGFELPQEITVEEGDAWLKGVGDPQFVMYYEQFPQAEQENWQISQMTTLSWGIAIGTFALDMVPVAGKVAGAITKRAAEKASFEITKKTARGIAKVSRAKEYVYDATAKKYIVDPMKNAADKVGSVFKSSLEKSLSKFMTKNPKTVEEAVELFTEDVVSTVNKLESPELIDDVLAKLEDPAQYFSEAGELSEASAQSFSDDVTNAYREVLSDKKYTGVLQKEAYGIEETGEKILFTDGIMAGQKLSKEGVEDTHKLFDYTKNPTEWKKAYDDYFYYKAKNNIVNNFKGEFESTIGVSDEMVRARIGQTLKMSLVKENGILEKRFLTEFEALKKTTGGLDEELFKKSVGQMETALKNMNPDAKLKLANKMKGSMQNMLNTKGEFDTQKFLSIAGGDASSRNALRKSMDDLYLNRESQGFKGLFDEIDAIGHTQTSGFAAKGGVIATATAVALYSSWMDSTNEKFTPAGYNNIAISSVSSYESRKIIPLDNRAKDYFIQIDKGEEDGNFVNRLFLVSPCKTDLNLKVKKCTCAAEQVVEENDGQWSGYLKNTSNGYIPLRNVPSDVKFSIQEIDGEPMPILDDSVNVDWAVKDCQERNGFFGSPFNNVDVKIDCIVVSEGANALNNYENYNEGYNYCYTGENRAATAAKGVILASQIGITMAVTAGTFGVGVVPAAAISSAGGIWLNYAIDEKSKWPRRGLTALGAADIAVSTVTAGLVHVE